MNATSDANLLLTGTLPFLMLVSAALTAPVAFFLLWLYRRAVVRAMNVSAGVMDTPLPPAPAVASRTDSSPLRIVMLDSNTAPTLAPKASMVYSVAAGSLKRAAVSYAAAGLVYALIFTVAWMIRAEGGFILSRFLWLSLCHAWPIVLALNLLTAMSRGERMAVAGIYFTLLSAAALWVLLHNPDYPSGLLAFFWLYVNGPGTLLLLAFLQRRIRAVGPLVLAFMSAGVAGALIMLGIAASDDDWLRALVTLGSALNWGASEVFIALNVIGFALFAIFGVWLLRWIGRRYQQKRFSDQSLTLDALWLLFAVVQSIILVFEGWVWFCTGLVAFAAYKLTVRTALASQFSKRTAGPVLLLLRVFSLGKRSERLFDSLAKRWLRAGSIALIAGPDLVSAIVAPHEFLEFVGGRLERRFVQSREELDQRLARLDTQPDPDGRHRVNEFFCRSDTWQMTMQQLAARSDAVLMDLRSFSPANQGCLYELAQLLENIPLQRVLFIIDATTDRAFLEQTLRRLGSTLRADSPNRRVEAAEIRLFQVRGQSARDAAAVLKLLLGTEPALKPSGAR